MKRSVLSISKILPKIGMLLVLLLGSIPGMEALDFPQLRPSDYHQSTDRAQLIIGDDSPDETLVITDFFEQTGDIHIVNSGQLRLEGSSAHLLHNGNLDIRGNGQFIINGGSYTSNQRYRYQFTMELRHSGQAHFSNAHVFSNGHPASTLLADSAYITYTDTVSETHFTGIAQDNSRVEVTRSSNSLELILTGAADVDFNDSSGSLLWLGFTENEVADFSLPDTSGVIDWHFSSDLPGVTGVDYRLDVTNCDDTILAVVSWPGSNITLRNSTVRALGVYLGTGSSTSINGLVNNSTYTDKSFDFNDRRIRLIKTTVETWNVYAGGDSEIKLDSCILGEVITYDMATCELLHCMVDGSGGYLGARDESILLLFFSSNFGELVSTDYSATVCFYSTLTTGRTVFTDSASSILYNSTLDRMPETSGSSIVYYLEISDPYWQAPLDCDVPVIGSVNLLKGVGAFSKFKKFSMAYGAGEEPTQWIPLGSDGTEPVMDDELAIWNTRGLSAGTYTIQMTVNATYRDPVTVEKMVELGPIPTYTPRPTATPAVEPTSTPIPAGVQIGLSLDDPRLSSGDLLCLRGELSNGDVTTTLMDLYVVLELGGLVWFWPDWSVEPDFQRRYLAGNTGQSEVFLELSWPAGVDPGSATFYGVLMEPGTFNMISDVAMATLEWE